MRVLRSIRSRLLALVVATVIPFTVLVVAGLWTRWKIDHGVAIAQAVNEARVLAAQIDEHIGNLENLLTGLSEAVSADPLDREANDALLRKVRSELPGYVAQLSAFSLDGTNIGSSGQTEMGRVNATGRAYMEQILAGQRFSIGDVIVGTLSQRWIVNFGRPLEDRGGRLRAVLVVGTWLDQFQNALRLQDLPAGTIVSIVNQKGTIIARSRDSPKWVGRDVSDWHNLARHFVEKEGSDISVWTSDGIERVNAFSVAHRAPWMVLVGQPTNSLFAAAAFRLATAASFIIGTLVIGFSIAWILSGRIARPLRQLGRDASLLASGRLSHRSAVRTDDEVGVLADDFNRMATALEERAREAHGAADEIRQAKDTLDAVIDASPVAIVCCDVNRRTMLWNRTAESMFGYSAHEVIGLPSKLTPPNATEESHSLFERALNGETLRNVEVKRVRKDGSLIHVRVAAAPMYNLDGTVRGVARAYEDITDSKRAQEQLSRLAHYDPLTGLPNRLSLQKELGRLLAGCQHKPVSLALFDLDGFKDVNDTLGHSTGDQLLIDVCQRFIEITDDHARSVKVCRLGGDEFVVIIPDCGDPRVIAELVDLVLTRLKDPFDVNGNILHLGCSAGIAIALRLSRQCGPGVIGGRRPNYRFFLPVLRAQMPPASTPARLRGRIRLIQARTMP